MNEVKFHSLKGSKIAACRWQFELLWFKLVLVPHTLEGAALSVRPVMN